MRLNAFSCLVTTFTCSQWIACLIITHLLITFLKLICKICLYNIGINHSHITCIVNNFLSTISLLICLRHISFSFYVLKLASHLLSVSRFPFLLSKASFTILFLKYLCTFISKTFINFLVFISLINLEFILVDGVNKNLTLLILKNLVSFPQSICRPCILLALVEMLSLSHDKFSHKRKSVYGFSVLITKVFWELFKMPDIFFYFFIFKIFNHILIYS